MNNNKTKANLLKTRKLEMEWNLSEEINKGKKEMGTIYFKVAKSERRGKTELIKGKKIDNEVKS